MIDFSYVPLTARASGVFIEQEFKRGNLGGLVIPQKLAVIGQYDSSLTVEDYMPRLITSAAEARELYGAGSHLARMVARVLEVAGTVPVYACPVPAPTGGAQASGSLTVSGTASTAGTIALYIAGEKVQVGIASGDSAETVASSIADAVNSDVDLPVTASASLGTVTVTAKWVGTIGNTISLSIEEQTVPTGVMVAISQLSGGTGTSDLSEVFTAWGSEWYTVAVLGFNDLDAYTAVKTAGDARIYPGVRRPFLAVAGYRATLSQLLTDLAGIDTQWLSIVPVPGSRTPECEIGAVAAGVIARSAQSDPARPFKGLSLAGVDGSTEKWTYAQQDQVVRSGGSTTYTEADGTVKLGDVATTYKGEDEAWMFATTVTNVQAKIYSLEQLFTGEPFDRAVVVDDSTVTGKSYVVSPKRVKAFLINLIDQLWIPQAWSTERDAIVASIEVERDAANPGRLNARFTDVLSAGLRIVAVKYNWSFYPPT